MHEHAAQPGQLCAVEWTPAILLNVTLSLSTFYSQLAALFTSSSWSPLGSLSRDRGVTGVALSRVPSTALARACPSGPQCCCTDSARPPALCQGLASHSSLTKSRPHPAVHQPATRLTCSREMRYMGPQTHVNTMKRLQICSCCLQILSPSSARIKRTSKQPGFQLSCVTTPGMLEYSSD